MPTLLTWSSVKREKNCLKVLTLLIIIDGEELTEERESTMAFVARLRHKNI